MNKKGKKKVTELPIVDAAVLETLRQQYEAEIESLVHTIQGQEALLQELQVKAQTLVPALNDNHVRLNEKRQTLMRLRALVAKKDNEIKKAVEDKK
jgi:hypothetical protein